MLCTWRKERKKRRGEKKKGKERERKNHRTTRKVSIRVHARATEKCKARLPWRSWNSWSSSLYIRELPLRICRATTFAGYSVHRRARSCARSQTFFSPQARDTTTAVLTRAFSHQTKVRKRKGGKGGRDSNVANGKVPHFSPRDAGARCRYRQKARDRRYSRVILRLQEVELLLDPVAGLGNRELEWLVRLRWTLRTKEKKREKPHFSRSSQYDMNQSIRVPETSANRLIASSLPPSRCLPPVPNN